MGLVVIVAAARTRGIAPDQSFAPRPITNPRMWFVLTWGAGIAVAVALSLLGLPEVVKQLIMLALSLSLMMAGSVWALRWLERTACEVLAGQFGTSAALGAVVDSAVGRCVGRGQHISGDRDRGGSGAGASPLVWHELSMKCRRRG